MRHWIKLYTEALDDPKLHRLSDAEYRAYFNLLMVAGIVDRDGAVGTLPEIAFRLRMPPSRAKQILDQICAKGIEISSGSTEIYSISAFSQRQQRPPSANPEAVADRVARHRAAKQAESEACNDVTPSLQAPSNDPVTTIEEKRGEEKRTDESGRSSNAGTAPPKTASSALPPGVKVFQNVRHKFPPRANWDQIANSIGEQEKDLQFWRDVLIAWSGEGWNLQSVTGPLDYFKRHEMPGANPRNGSSGHAYAKPAKGAAARDHWNQKLEDLKAKQQK